MMKSLRFQGLIFLSDFPYFWQGVSTRPECSPSPVEDLENRDLLNLGKQDRYSREGRSSSDRSSSPPDGQRIAIGR